MMNKRKRDRVEGGSWSSISGDILCLAAEKIEFIEEYVSFCAVCRHWYVNGSEFYNLKKKFDFKAPFYMYGHDPDPDTDKNGYHIFKKIPNPSPSPKLRFRSFGSKRSFAFESPETSWRRCWGSPFGWLVTYGAVDLQFSLVNPFPRATIALPSMTTLFPGLVYHPPWLSIKAFLTADPVESPENCFVIVVVMEDWRKFYRIGYSRPGKDCAWSPISLGDHVGGLSDVVSFQGKLYGVTSSCYDSMNVFLIQIQPSARLVEVLGTTLDPGDPTMGIPGRDLVVDYKNPGKNNYFVYNRKYLFELNGELCLVLRYIMDEVGGRSRATGYFKVFKIDLSAGSLTRVWPLGDRCLFVGNHSTFTYETSSPPPEEFKRVDHLPDSLMNNHVFYTYDDDWVTYLYLAGPSSPDVGVWEMLRSDKVYDSTEILTKYPPLWMIPSIRLTRLKEVGGLRRCNNIHP